jgi:PadR family transcriptional regulator PadR
VSRIVGNPYLTGLWKGCPSTVHDPWPGIARTFGTADRASPDGVRWDRTRPPLWTSPVDIRPRIGVHSCRMPSQSADNERAALLQGTLDLLILRTLVFGSRHGQGIARSIQQQSEDVFLVDHGSLYLALQRLEDKGWVKAEWGVSANNRKARFYTLTAKGRKQLAQKTNQWRRVAKAISRILAPGEAEV